MSFGSYGYGSSSYGGLPETIIIDYEFPVKLNIILRQLYKLNIISRPVYKLNVTLRQPFKIDINLR